MAVRFNAVSEYYTATLAAGTISQFTVCCWCKLSADRNAVSAMWEISNAAAGTEAIMETMSDGTGMGLFNQSGTQLFNQPMTVGTWYWFGCAVNGVNGTCLVRALNATSFTVYSWSTGSATVNAQTVWLAEAAGLFPGEWMNGCLAAVKIWTGAALTQAELEAEAWTYRPRRTANLRGWYPLLRTETTDYSGGGRTLTGGTGASIEDGPGVSWGA
jgi:hypothetical protein